MCFRQSLKGSKLPFDYLTSCISIMVLMDNTQQGFYQDTTTTVCVQDAFTSTPHQPQPHSLHFLHHSAPNPYSQHLDRSPLITHKIRQDWMLKLYAQNQHSVVYNNVRRDLVSGLPDSGVAFDSNFEGGNLDLVVKVSHKEYELYMRPDTNTMGHEQWFNFKVRVCRRGKVMRFRVRNFNKGNLLYSQGLAPYAKSIKSNSNLWAQIEDTESVKFQQDEQGHSCLTFDYTFSHDYDQVQFCTQPPYTFQRLKERMLAMGLTSSNLCVSLLKIKIPKLEIGQKNIEELSGVGLAIGRQHPGESVGSWMMEGFISSLVENTPENFLWVIVPMVNVDGVVLGNNRTGIVGYDLNRLYNQDQKKISAKSQHVVEVKGILQLVRKLKRKYGRLFQIFLDFHGHSTKKNVFSYGPNYSQLDKQPFTEGTYNLLHRSARLLPKLISLKTPLFTTSDCSYTIHPSKANTARSILFNKFKVPFCYTLEASYGLADGGKRLTNYDYLEVGRQIAKSSNQFLMYLTRKSEEGWGAQYKTMVEQIRGEIERPGAYSQEEVSDKEDSSYDGSNDDLNEEYREDITAMMEKQKINYAASTKTQKAATIVQANFSISSSYNRQTSHYVIDSKTLREAQKHMSNKGTAFVSRLDLRKEFRFKRVTQMPSQSYAYQPYNQQQKSTNVKLNPQPQPQISPSKPLPPLKFPDTRPPQRKISESHRREPSQRRLYTQTQRGPSKKMSAHLLSQSYQPPANVKNSLLQRQLMLRQIAKNKKNKVGTRLLIINQI